MPISNPSNQFGNSQFVVDPTVGVASYQTITAALAASSAGDTIYIRPGTYTEDLTANMAGKSISAAAVGNNNYEVTVVGNHVFDDVGSVGFENISFTSSSGSGWIVGAAGAGTYSAEFEGCSISNSAGIALTTASAAGSANVTMFSCTLNGSTQGANLANGTCNFNSTYIIGGSAEAMECGAGLTFNGFDVTYEAAAADAVLLSDATAAFNSKVGRYDCADAAIRFTDNGSARSLNEEINSSDAAGFWVDASAATGLFSYAGAVILGSAVNIDPQVTATALPVEGGGSIGIADWLDDPASGALLVNRGYMLSSGAKSFSLPAASSFGDEIRIVLRGGTSWAVTQGAGQTIYIGNSNTTTGAGGSIASIADGDSIHMVCAVADTDWVICDSIGNFTVT